MRYHRREATRARRICRDGKQWAAAGSSTSAANKLRQRNNSRKQFGGSCNRLSGSDAELHQGPRARDDQLCGSLRSADRGDAPLYLDGLRPRPESPRFLRRQTAYGTSLSTPSGLGTSWDPYLTAQRPAILSGNNYVSDQQPIHFAAADAAGAVLHESARLADESALYDRARRKPTRWSERHGDLPRCDAAAVGGDANGADFEWPLPPTLFIRRSVRSRPGARWYVDADGIFLTRDARIGTQAIVLLDMNAATQSNVLLSNANLDDFQFEPGTARFDRLHVLTGECDRNVVLRHLQLESQQDDPRR